MNYIDLGLSVKWADCNFGANSPEEFGDYFTWEEAINKDLNIPSKEQWLELIKNCKIKWDKKKNVFVVTGPNGNTISLPIPGEQNKLDQHESGGFYWTSVLSIFDDRFAYYVFFIKRRNTQKIDMHMLTKDKYKISVRTIK